MLLKKEQSIAVTPHPLRCHCAVALEVDRIGYHFPGVELVPALEQKEKLFADVDAEKLQVDLRSQRIERNWQNRKKRAHHLEGTWDQGILPTAPEIFSMSSKVPSRLRFGIGRLDEIYNYNIF